MGELVQFKSLDELEKIIKNIEGFISRPIVRGSIRLCIRIRMKERIEQYKAFEK